MKMETEEEISLDEVDENGIQCEVINSDSIYVTENQEQYEGLTLYPITIVEPTKQHDYWSNQETCTLISLHKTYDERFKTAPPGAKKEIWEEISKQMSLRGSNKTSVACDDKWRRLKCRYMMLKDKYTKKGIKGVPWTFYYQMQSAVDMDDSETDKPLTQTEVDALIDGLEEVTEDHSYFKDTSQDIKMHGEKDEQDDAVEEENDESMEISKSQSSDGFWTVTNTKLLIALRRGYSQKFASAPQGKKIYLWKEIAEKIKRQGFNVSAFECNSKYRRLKTRYKRMKGRGSKQSHPIKWIYYKDLDAFLSKEIYEDHKIEDEHEAMDLQDQVCSASTSNILGHFLSTDSNKNNNSLMNMLGMTLISELITEKKKINQMAAQKEKSFQERIANLETMNKILMEQNKETQELLRLQTVELIKANELETKKIELIEKSLSAIVNKSVL